MEKKSFILNVLNEHFGGEKIAKKIFESSDILQYLGKKTKSVNKSSKSRSSFANLYAIYALVEDYLEKGYFNNENYLDDYEGMKFTDALNRMRSLNFGEKLQNHALNNRCNHEFKKYFHKEVIIVNQEDKKYFINDKLLYIKINGKIYNIAEVILKIIDKYVELKIKNFNTFFETCESLINNIEEKEDEAREFIEQQLDEKTDARIFEIVSFLICKYHYSGEKVYFGFDRSSIQEVPLNLYKTGRTNANDGGIDFIMIPLGRVFQVTEVIDFKKYFLDIEKINKFPITFIVKTNKSPLEVMEMIRVQAEENYSTDIVNRYLGYFEEIITLPILREYFQEILNSSLMGQFFYELIQQCTLEYNIN